MYIYPIILLELGITSSIRCYDAHTDLTASPNIVSAFSNY